MPQGIDVRQTSGQIVFRAALIDGDGGLLASGDADLYLYELQTDGTLKSYDFDDNTFKTTALTTATASLTHRKGDNDSTNTGYWTHVLSTLTGFTAGNICIAMVHHDSAGPQDQHREFQFGSAQGDLTVTDGRLKTDAAFDDGMVWIDAAGTASTAWPYGIASYPTDTIARGKTIADANNLHRFHCHGGLTFAAAMENYSFVGELHNTDSLDVNGQSIEHSTLSKLLVTGSSGNGAAIGDQTSYISCSIYDYTNIQGGASNCLVDGACSIRDGGYASFLDCLFGSYAACNLTLQAPTECDIVNMRGHFRLMGMDGGVCSVSMQNGASVSIHFSCSAGTINITGTGTVIDTSAEGCTVNVRTPETDLVQWLGVAPLALAAQRVQTDVRALAGGTYKVADTTGNWATAGTWADGVVPAAGDNIIIRNGVTVTIAASLDLGQFGTQELQGDGKLNIAAGQTVAQVPAGWIISTNSNGGEVTNNYGTVTTNSGMVTNNRRGGTVIFHGGTMTNNYGTVTNNDGDDSTVTNNRYGGIVTNNGLSSTVTTNYGTVIYNDGTVTTNSNGGEVMYNEGTVTTNSNGGTVMYNYDTITTNNSGGIVLNYGTITTNNGEATTFNSPDKALIATNLDHLLKIATAAADMTAEVADDTILARALTGGDTSTFAPATMSQKDIVADTDELQTDWADGGRLKEILDSIPTTGSGSVSWTINVKVGGNPIDGAEVRITSDEEGNTAVAGPKYTDASGDVDFLLDPGTYYAWISASGKDFSNPTTVTVTE